MTPANPDALAEALKREPVELADGLNPDEVISLALLQIDLGYQTAGENGRAQMLSVQVDWIIQRWAKAEADLQRVAAERDEARADQKAAEDSNDALNVKLHTLAPHGSCACSYDKPGDVCMHHSPALAAAEARAAQLQAEVEALKEERVALRADANALGARLGNTSQYDDPKALRDLCWEAGNFIWRRIVSPDRTALAARAATAREG